MTALFLPVKCVFVPNLCLIFNSQSNINAIRTQVPRVGCAPRPVLMYHWAFNRIKLSLILIRLMPSCPGTAPPKGLQYKCHIDGSAGGRSCNQWRKWEIRFEYLLNIETRLHTNIAVARKNISI